MAVVFTCRGVLGLVVTCRIHPLHIPSHACAREPPGVAAALRASAASVFGGAPAGSARSSRSFAAVVATSAVGSAVTAA